MSNNHGDEENIPYHPYLVNAISFSPLWSWKFRTWAAIKFTYVTFLPYLPCIQSQMTKAEKAAA